MTSTSPLLKGPFLMVTKVQHRLINPTLALSFTNLALYKSQLIGNLSPRSRSTRMFLKKETRR